MSLPFSRPPAGFTDPLGRRLPTAPAAWPFGTITPPSPAQLRAEVLARTEDAPW